MNSFESFPMPQEQEEKPEAETEKEALPEAPQIPPEDSENPEKGENKAGEVDPITARKDQIGREEKEKKIPARLEQARQGLGELYELLPRNRKAEEKEIIDLIDHTRLEEMMGGARKILARAIRKDSLNQGDKAEFIAKGVDALGIWINIEAKKDSGDDMIRRWHEEGLTGEKPEETEETTEQSPSPEQEPDEKDQSL